MSSRWLKCIHFRESTHFRKTQNTSQVVFLETWQHFTALLFHICCIYKHTLCMQSWKIHTLLHFVFTTLCVCLHSSLCTLCPSGAQRPEENIRFPGIGVTVVGGHVNARTWLGSMQEQVPLSNHLAFQSTFLYGPFRNQNNLNTSDYQRGENQTVLSFPTLTKTYL